MRDINNMPAGGTSASGGKNVKIDQVDTEQKNSERDIFLKNLLRIGLLVIVLVFVGSFVKTGDVVKEDDAQSSSVSMKEEVLPKEGVELPIKWGDLGKRMLSAGVIDKNKFDYIYAQSGGLSEEELKMAYGEYEGNVVINEENSGVLLNLLWAFGLSNKNPILDKGPMTDAQFGGDAGRFASTAGWTISVGNPMSHYSMHNFVNLTEEQQKLVEKVSLGIFRPCCGNPVFFPDCNHGMAMLGLLELLAEQGAGEDEMYKIALKVNSYWFPDTYLTLSSYYMSKGVKWQDVDAREVLSAEYSSANGYQNILSKMNSIPSGSGAGCSV